jgi:hypothetical protein
MSFEITGKLHKKFDTEKKTETFQAREFVILVEEGNYPQYVKFQLTQDRCSLVDSFDEGQSIKVSFDLRGREWQGKYFTNLNAWRIQQPDQQAEGQSFSDDPFPAESFPSASDAPGESESTDSFDDLPF